MSKGFRLRAMGCALAALTAGLAVTATAGASDGGRAIQAQDACDPATFPAGLCARPDTSGPRVTFDGLFADLAKQGRQGQWRFTQDKVKVHRGEAVSVTMGRGGELHTFSDVTATGFGPGCVPEINQVLFGSPAVADACSPIDPGAGVPAIFLRDGLFPGRTIAVDTSARGTHLFECMIHPWMRTTVTVD
jgi:plastocyanin